MRHMILSKLKQKNSETPYSFKQRFQGIQRVAIIYPERTQWMRIARYALQRMYNLPEKFDYLLLVPPASSRPVLNIQHEYSDILHHPNKDDRLVLQSKITAFNPDILLQLEPEPSDRLIKMIKTIDTPLKMGFGSENSDLNVIYSQKESGFYEKNILNLIGLLETK